LGARCACEVPCDGHVRTGSEDLALALGVLLLDEDVQAALGDDEVQRLPIDGTDLLAITHLLLVDFHGYPPVPTVVTAGGPRARVREVLEADVGAGRLRCGEALGVVGQHGEVPLLLHLLVHLELGHPRQLAVEGADDGRLERVGGLRPERPHRYRQRMRLGQPPDLLGGTVLDLDDGAVGQDDFRLHAL
jgi:hypothetical protein